MTNAKWPAIILFTENYIWLKHSALNYRNQTTRAQFAELVKDSAGILKTILGIFGRTDTQSSRGS